MKNSWEILFDEPDRDGDRCRVKLDAGPPGRVLLTFIGDDESCRPVEVAFLMDRIQGMRLAAVLEECFERIGRAELLDVADECAELLNRGIYE